MSCYMRNCSQVFGARRKLFTESSVDTTSANFCVQTPTTALSPVPAIRPLADDCALAIAHSPQQSHALCLPESSSVTGEHYGNCEIVQAGLVLCTRAEPRDATPKTARDTVFFAHANCTYRVTRRETASCRCRDAHSPRSLSVIT